MATRNRAGKAEKQQRIDEVYDHILSGETSSRILRFITSEYGVSYRQAQNYLAEATALVVSESEWHKGKGFAQALTRLNDLYLRNIKNSDFPGALQVQREINKLLALHMQEAPKTILLGDLEPAQAQVWTDALEKRGLRVSAVVEAMLAQLAYEDATDE